MNNVYDHNAISIDVGARLRALRQAKGMSLRALARASGLSANALSLIERGQTSPTVSTLYRLADALGVPITAFFQEVIERSPVVFVKAGERPRLLFARGLWEGLGGERFTGRVEPFVLTLEVGAHSGPHPMVHSGHEFVFCLRGLLEYQVEDQRYLLEPGDALLFAARMRHQWRNAGRTVTNVLFVLSGFEEGERLGPYHVHKPAASTATETEKG